MKRITHLSVYLTTMILCFQLSAKETSTESMCMITVKYPNSQTVWDTSETVTISWNSDYLKGREGVYETLRIDLQIEGEFISVARDIEDAGSYSWKVPDSLKHTSKARVHVSFADHSPDPYGSYCNISSEFSINGRPHLKLTAPRQGSSEIRWELYHLDSLNETLDISWESMGSLPNSYDLFYRTTDMKTWEPVQQQLQTQSYCWPIPYVNASQSYLFKVVSASRPEVSDTTAFPVTITPVPRRVEFPSYVYESRPQFNWHPVGGVDTFFIEAKGKTAPGFTAIVADTFYNPQSELPEGRIYWRVVPLSRASKLADLEQYSSFYCLPMELELIEPEENPTRNTKPVLSWHPMIKMSDFIVFLSSSEAFTKNSTYIVDTTSDTSYQPDIDLPFGTIYWKVKSLKFNCFSGTGKVLVVPDTLPFLKPFKGDTVRTVKPVFEWEPIEKAQEYKIEIFSESEVALGKRKAGKNTNLFLIHSEIVNTTKYIPPVDLPTGKLFWHVSSDKNFEEFSPLDQMIVDANSYPMKTSNPSLNKPFQIFHNANGTIHVRLKDSETTAPGMIKLYSLQGKCVYSQSFYNSSRPIDLSGHTGSGLYILKVSTQNRAFVSKISFH